MSYRYWSLGGGGRTLPLLLGVLAAFSGAAGCAGSCASEEQLAELTTLQGARVERDSASAQRRWHKAQLHDRFQMGDGLRTGPDSEADLALSPSGVAHVEPGTLLRFLASAPTSHSVSLESGTVEIVAEQMDIEVHTPRAVAKLTHGSKMKLTASEGRERFDLVVGRVVVSHDDSQQVLEPEQALELGPPAAQASAADVPLDAGSPAGPADASPSEPATQPASGETVNEARPAATAELNLVAIEPATIHAPQLPVDAHLSLPPCAEGTKLLVDGHVLSAAERDGALRLPAGRHRLRVLCGGELTKESQIVVKRDAAKLEIPKRAQSVRVEADGRRYTVLYQNLLPFVSFVWPGNHDGSKFTLLLRRGKRDRSFELSRPEHALPGNTLGEGEHKFWFRDARGRSSKPGSIRLSFDNAARSAYLSSPAEGSPASDTVLVEGAALLRSEVQVDGTPVALDEKGRFRRDVALKPGQRTIAVRVQHPESGVHYYLRHLRLEKASQNGPM